MNLYEFLNIIDNKDNLEIVIRGEDILEIYPDIPISIWDKNVCRITITEQPDDLEVELEIYISR